MGIGTKRLRLCTGIIEAEKTLVLQGGGSVIGAGKHRERRRRGAGWWRGISGLGLAAPRCAGSRRGSGGAELFKRRSAASTRERRRRNHGDGERATRAVCGVWCVGGPGSKGVIFFRRSNPHTHTQTHIGFWYW